MSGRNQLLLVLFISTLILRVVNWLLAPFIVSIPSGFMIRVIDYHVGKIITLVFLIVFIFTRDPRLWVVLDYGFILRSPGVIFG